MICRNFAFNDASLPCFVSSRKPAFIQQIVNHQVNVLLTVIDIITFRNVCLLSKLSVFYPYPKNYSMLEECSRCANPPRAKYPLSA